MNGPMRGDNRYPSVIDTAQVAELLQMNVQMVRKYAREGRLPAYQLPRSRVYRFLYSEVIDFLKAHPVAPDVDWQQDPARTRPGS